MPRKSSKAVASQRIRVIKSEGGFNVLHLLGGAILTALVSLLGTGVISMIVLYTNVATLTDAQKRFEANYEKRDASIQRQLNDKATKEEVNELRQELKESLSDLKEVVRTTAEGMGQRRR